MAVVAINAMVVDQGHLSGIGQYIARLGVWFGVFAREGAGGHRVLMFCRPEAVHHFGDIDGIEIVSIPAPPGRIGRVLAEQFWLPRVMQREGVNALLNPAFTGPLRGAPRIVTTVQDLYFRVVPDLMPRAQRWFFRVMVPFCCRRSEIVVTTSASTRRDLGHFYPDLAGRTVVIPLANRFAAPQSLPARREVSHFVLMVAALTGNKNPEPLVAAIGALRERYPTLTLVHVGSDREQRLAAAVEAQDAQDWVSTRTGISDADLAALYAECLCVAIPSLYEGFGLPLLEAQALGAPVVASNSSALPEVGGQGALYFDPTSPREISEAIEQLLVSPSQREALRSAGFVNQARFSWESTARKTWRLLCGVPPEGAGE